MTHSWKDIHKIALPAIISSIAEPLITLGDQAIVGHMSNAGIALSAVGSAALILNAMIWVLSQSKSSISAIIANALGKKEVEKTQSLIINVIFFNLLLSAFCIISTQFFADHIMQWVSTPDAAKEAAVSYLKIRVWGIPLTLLTFMFFGILRGLQNTSYAMYISIMAGLVNIGLDYLFILKWNWGIPGAAYASIIAQALMLIVTTVLLLQKTFIQFKWSKEVSPLFKNYLNLTFNFILRTVALNIALFFGQKYANNISLEDGAVYSVLMNLWLFCAFFLDGYSHAANAIGGRLYGSKNKIELHILGKRIIIAEISTALFLVGFIYLFRSPIASVMTIDLDIQKMLVHYLPLVLVIQGVNALAFGFDGLYKGMGKAKLLRNLLMVSSFVFFLPLLYLLNYWNTSLTHIFIAFWVWMGIRAFYLIYHFFFRLDMEDQLY